MEFSFHTDICQDWGVCEFRWLYHLPLIQFFSNMNMHLGQEKLSCIDMILFTVKMHFKTINILQQAKDIGYGEPYGLGICFILLTPLSL